MGVLGQLDPKAAAEGLGANFLPWALVIVLFALAWVVKAYVDQGQKHALELAAVQKEARETQRADAKETRELLMQIVPLSAKLTEGLESLERITDRLTRE
jgi:apolipoprotein N-acyltransferase